MSSSSIVKNPLKAALRKRMKGILLALSPENKREQSDAVTAKVSLSSKFNRSSMYYTEFFGIFVVVINCSFLANLLLVLIPSLSSNDCYLSWPNLLLGV